MDFDIKKVMDLDLYKIFEIDLNASENDVSFFVIVNYIIIIELV